MLLCLMAITALCHLFLFCLHVLVFSILIQHSNSTESTDCLENNSVNSSSITDGTSANNLGSLISPGKIFELGFFTPEGNTENLRYLGIWYYESNPKIIVWVANRDNPLMTTNGSLVIELGNAKLLDGNGIARWSTNGSLGTSNSIPTSHGNMPSSNELLHFSYPSENVQQQTTTTIRPTKGKATNATVFNSKLCLLDSGNLVLYYRQNPKDENPYSWQSFEHPTDTFLPAMNAVRISDPTKGLNLTSWQNYNNPARGSFTFELQPGFFNEFVIVETGHSHYWESTTTAFDKNASELSKMLSDPRNSTVLLKTRLVMNFTGQIQLWKWENERIWSLNWSVPKDRCSLSDVCGNFASCNSNNVLLCKCLPGFKPSPQWEAGDTSGGCNPISAPPNNRNDSLNDIFVQLPLMAVGNETCTAFNEENCTERCLNDPICVAYSIGYGCSVAVSGISTDRREKKCSIWHTVLDNLQEDSLNGISLYVRTRISDIEPYPGGCNPCGAYIIPYPLSTGSNCGDPSYFSFHCDSRIGQLNFSTSNGNFKVTSIDPNNQKFSIQVIPANRCDSSFINNVVLSDNDSSSFTIRSCKVFRDIPLLQVDHPLIEVEIGWKPPLGPLCNVTSDCNPWSHTTCKKVHGFQMRCVCASKFNWDGLNLKCTRVLPLTRNHGSAPGHDIAPSPLKLVVSSIVGALVILLGCFLLIVYLKRKRRMIEKQGSNEYSKEDTEGIDVPYFDWENILAATDNFTDANKLGVGGFGSVYMGKLSDGQKIAVKRLSSVSVQGAEEFRTEVKLIAKLQHRNLVRLVGYCIKASEKILVYEYMPNGSLDSCLYDEKHHVDLDWEKRNDIILGIARGLLYLHQDSRLRIIHRDLKPSNILLDEELNPKISDFGIAKIVGGKETQASTGRIVGTYGYMSPEYASDGIFSVKSDVFSFGVVVLETISGKRNSRIFMIENGLSLLGYAWKLWNDGRGLELMDPKLNESCSASEVLKCIHIGLLCVQEDPSDRPTMSTVVHMLTGENVSLPLAKQPAFMNRKPLSDTASSSNTKDMADMITISTVGR